MPRDHLSYSAFTRYQACAQRAWAEDNDLVRKETTDEMLIGSYVDRKLLGGFEAFQKENAYRLVKFPTLEVIKIVHPELGKMKVGDLKKSHPQLALELGEPCEIVERAERMVARARADNLFMRFMDGDHQVKGEVTIDGVPYVVIADVVSSDCCVDLKTTGSIAEWAWDSVEHRRTPWWYHARYWLQGALQCEAFKKDKFYTAVLTRENPPDIGVLEFRKEMLDRGINELRLTTATIWEWSQKGNGPGCGRCDWCRGHHKAVVSLASELEWGSTAQQSAE